MKNDQEPVLLINVWDDKGLPCFNIEWISSPTYYAPGEYKLYLSPPKPRYLDAIANIPTRTEMLSGQSYKYVKLEEVIAVINSLEG